ncbi:phospholipase D-like domain-containing protein [Spiroplasma mirum]|uniref:phospholipase D-like domain-containing protein n=1 Tax=Spiroplasma mirum TaxID=2144 RepID=UPI0003DFF089|nr:MULTISPECIES: phospholipase D-like domain-containing protein [Spiroplasma]AHF61283.1 hypothetical protein SMM_0893 [Spiroplasma mirum ATCC 29335]AKM53345.1 type II deoxyribonuclease [Spiroplasma atrichopogonis]
MIKFIKNPFLELFLGYIRKCAKNIIIYSPYIKKQIASEILNNKQKNVQLKIITSWNLPNFINKSLDLEAIELLIKNNINILALENLYAKIYIFNESSALITSSILTFNSFNKNFEYGTFIWDDNKKIKEILKNLDSNEKKINKFRLWKYS